MATSLRFQYCEVRFEAHAPAPHPHSLDKTEPMDLVADIFARRIQSEHRSGTLPVPTARTPTSIYTRLFTTADPAPAARMVSNAP